MTRKVSLPEHLTRWIVQRLPVGDLSRIQFRLGSRIPFWWVVPWGSFSGLTLWNRIYVVENYWFVEPIRRSTLELILHELVHVVQYRRNPITFPFRYVLDHLRYGYERNPAEVEARAIAARLADSFYRELGDGLDMGHGTFDI
jgi:hypothetical protein